MDKALTKSIIKAKAAGMKVYNEKQDALAEIKGRIQQANLKYRYFRNNSPYRNRTNTNHNGVICLGYRVIKDDFKGINFDFCIAFCSPNDSFSRFEAKKLLSRRYIDGETVNITVSFGSEKEIITIIKGIWNSHKIPEGN